MTNTLTNLPPKTLATKSSDEVSDVNKIPSLKVRIPIDTDFKKLYNPFIINRKRGNDHNAWILGMLAYKSEVKHLSFNSYHSLSASVLRQLFRGDYKNYMVAMIEADYIKEYSNPYEYKANGNVYKSNGSYKPGLSAKKYALAENKPIFKDYTITDEKLINKINRARIERTQRVINNNPTAKNVHESIKRLSIDGAAARSFFYEKYEIKTIKEWAKWLVRKIGKTQTRILIQEIQYTKKNKKNLLKILKKYKLNTTYYKEIQDALDYYNSLNSRLHQVNVIEQIEKGNFSYISMSEDKKTGRLFHTLTMTPKDLKPFLKIDNEALIELDASNCQWWMLQKLCNILIRKDFSIVLKGKKELNNVKKAQTPTPYIHQYLTHPTPNLLYVAHFLKNNRESIEKELKKLERALENFSFRELFIDKFKRQGKSVSDGDVKKWLLVNVLFSNPNESYHKDLTIVKEFGELFPYTTKIIKHLKTSLLNNHAFGYTDKDRWKCLALLLQRMEADVFIKDMANCNATYLTLHDALVTNGSNFHKVYNRINNSVKKRDLKIKFELKIKFD